MHYWSITPAYLSLVVLCCIALPGLTRAADPSLIREVERAIVEQTNDFRKENDLPTVELDENLNACASEFANFMAKTGKYGHQADGRRPAQRAEAAGYQYCVVRENIAYRTNTGEVTASGLIEVFVQGWIDSPPHRENMLADYVTETGVGVATTDGVTYYAVQLFGRPKSAAISLTVLNKSTDPRILVIEANDSVDQVELPPGTTLKMTRCFPTTLRLQDEKKELEVTKSAELMITAEGIEQ